MAYRELAQAQAEAIGTEPDVDGYKAEAIDNGCDSLLILKGKRDVNRLGSDTPAVVDQLVDGAANLEARAGRVSRERLVVIDALDPHGRLQGQGREEAPRNGTRA